MSFPIIFSVIFFGPFVGGLLINELNSNCPVRPGLFQRNVESCEFVELLEPDCNKYSIWNHLPGTYIVLVEAWDTNLEAPAVRLLMNLTGDTVISGQEYYSICYSENQENCNTYFKNKEIYQEPQVHRKLKLRNSYLMNGNKYPMIMFLINTDNHTAVSQMLLPRNPNHGSVLTKEAQTFIKYSLEDMVVYGRKTPFQGCKFIEDMISELKSRNIFNLTSVKLLSKNYINREYDVACPWEPVTYGKHMDYQVITPCAWRGADYSLNRCDGAKSMILAIPTIGLPNECTKHPTLLLQPTDPVFVWIEQHRTRYIQKKRFISNAGSCYVTWYSQLFLSFHPTVIAMKRHEIISNAPIVLSRRKRSDTDPDINCNSPNKKISRAEANKCSQNSQIIEEVAHACIAAVIKSRTSVKFFPPLSLCGQENTAQGEMLSLSEFDDSEVQVDDAENIGLASGTSSLADLIMSRAGFFNANTHNLRQTKVCRKHSEELGIGFQRKMMGPTGIIRAQTQRKTHIDKCIAPEIAGYSHTTVVQARRASSLTKMQSEALFREDGILIPVGLPVCKRHYEIVNKILVQHIERKKETAKQDRASTSYLLREMSAVCYQEISSQPLFCRADSDTADSLPGSQGTTCPLPETRLEKLRRLLWFIREDNFVSKWHYTDRYPTLQESTKRNYRLASRAAHSLINHALVGDDVERFESDVRDASDKAWNKGEDKLTEILITVNKLYETLQSATERKILLGVHALNVPYRILSKHISGITHYMYTASRHLARYYIAEQGPQSKPSHTRERTDRKSIAFFLHYTIEEMTPRPWGTKIKKTSCGVKVEIPSFLSQVGKKKQIKQFKEYARQIGKEDLILSDSMYYRILNHLNIVYRSAVTGLDYKTNAGLEAFDKLGGILCRLSELKFVETDQAELFSTAIDHARSYLRGDYKYHVSKSSSIADHCTTYALSDPAITILQKACDHEHKGVCQRCEQIKTLLNEVYNIVLDADFPDEREKQLMINDVTKAMADVEEMKYHKLRSVHQNSAKTEILKALMPNQVMIIADFAMKYLPTSGREDQTSWFGKKGINWHISYVIRKLNNYFEYKIYLHIFSHQVAQDSRTVMAIVNDTLRRLNQGSTDITEVFLRSDNAGSYHSAKTLAAVNMLNKQNVIKITRWDFSEAQDGKGPCDQTASTIKRRVRERVAENYKTNTASELAEAAHSDGGVQGVTTVVVDKMFFSKQPNYQTPSIPGIQSLSNFKFSANGDSPIIAWKAFGIGNGKEFSIEDRNAESSWIDVPSAQVYNSAAAGFIRMRQEAGDCLAVYPSEEIQTKFMDDSPAETSTDYSNSDVPMCFRMFQCPEHNCIKTFNKIGNLWNHLALGNHAYQLESETVSDYVLKTYSNLAIDKEVKEALDRIPEVINQYDNEHANTKLQTGFALRKATSRTRFTQKQRQFLVDRFLEGERSGSKFDARVISEEMRFIKMPDTDEPMFPADQLLTWQQISSYWSTYARKNKRQEFLANDNNQIEFENDQLIVMPDDEYIADPNVGTTDNEIDQAIYSVVNM